MRRIERDFRSADLAAVNSLIATLKPEDFIARWDLESRRDEIVSAIANVNSSQDVHASAALFFSGAPVIGSKGIESGFAANAIQQYQDVVSKVYASSQRGSIGERGVVAELDQSKLHVTNIVHGSFGFQFEEIHTQNELFESELSGAVDQVSKLMVAFDEPDEDDYTSTISDIDERVLDTLRTFFELLRTSNATFRIVSGEIDKSFNTPSIDRAVSRARVTSVQQVKMTFRGELRGVLPTSRDFEYGTELDKRVIRGKISRDISDRDIELMNRNWTGSTSQIDVFVKQVLRQGVVRRETYLLNKIYN